MIQAKYTDFTCIDTQQVFYHVFKEILIQFWELSCRHQYNYTGEKTNQCNHCEKSFPQQYYLVTHQNLTWEKPYEYNNCTKYITW